MGWMDLRGLLSRESGRASSGLVRLRRSEGNGLQSSRAGAQQCCAPTVRLRKFADRLGRRYGLFGWPGV